MLVEQTVVYTIVLGKGECRRVYRIGIVGYLPLPHLAEQVGKRRQLFVGGEPLRFDLISTATCVRYFIEALQIVASESVDDKGICGSVFHLTVVGIDKRAKVI